MIHRPFFCVRFPISVDSQALSLLDVPYFKQNKLLESAVQMQEGLINKD